MTENKAFIPMMQLKRKCSFKSDFTQIEMLCTELSNPLTKDILFLILLLYLPAVLNLLLVWRELVMRVVWFVSSMDSDSLSKLNYK